MKATLLYLFLAIALCTTACKKDQLRVDTEQTFIQDNFKFDTSSPYFGPWVVTLQPNKQVEIVPGGDIRYRGKYKVNGNKLKIETDEVSYEFEILSENQIKEKQYGTTLSLKR